MLEPYLSPGDGVIDLGANIGRYTVGYAKAVGKHGFVLAVEPDPENVKQLRKDVGGYPWVEVMACAVYACRYEGYPLAIDSGDRRRNSLWAQNTMRHEEFTRVALMPLDALAEKVPNLKAIKMDVQGAESHVLDGSQATLARDVIWQVEFWPEGLRNAGRSVDALVAQFQEHGYQPVSTGKNVSWDDFLNQIRNYDGHKSTDLVLRKPTNLPG